MSENNKSRYFDMTKAIDEFSHGSFGAKDKAVAGLKILGKGLFNVTKYAASEILPAVAEQAAKSIVRNGDKLLKNEELNHDQRSKAEETRERASDYLKAAEKKTKRKYTVKKIKCKRSI